MHPRQELLIKKASKLLEKPKSNKDFKVQAAEKPVKDRWKAEK